MGESSPDEDDGDRTDPASAPSDSSDDAVADGSKAGPDTDSSDGVLRTWLNRIGWMVAVLVVALVLLFALGIIGVPSAGLADPGDWGSVSADRTEVVTTVWVNNPNPVGISLGESLTVDYDIVMNGVVLAAIEKSDIAVPTGNNTVTVRTGLHNDRLADWWVGYVRADETINMTVEGTVTVRAGPLGGREMAVQPPNRTILTDERPVIGALSASANASTGTYAQSVDAGVVDEATLEDQVIEDVTDGESLTVGYEVQRGWATWDAVDEAETVVLFHLLVHNPGDIAVPAAPDGVGLAVDTNDVRLLEAETDEFTLRSVGPEAVIQPGETREVTFAVTMDNERVDDWFTSHVRESEGPGAEATAVSSQFQVVFEEPATGTTFRLPQDSPATSDCQFATRILVDEQPIETTCGERAAPGP